MSGYPSSPHEEKVEKEATERTLKKRRVGTLLMRTPSAGETKEERGKEEKGVDSAYSLERERKAEKAEKIYCRAEVESFAGRNTQALPHYRQAASLHHISACLWLLEYYSDHEENDEEQAEIPAWKNTVLLALNQLRKQAQGRNPRAQYDLAQCYKLGIGLEQSDAQAVAWYHLSALQNYAPAHFRLGLSYQYGDGMPEKKPNPEAAVKHYQRAAVQGYTAAQNFLGWCYEHGFGVKKNLKAAFQWFETAAAQGNLDAQNNLGLCYRDGLGVPTDEFKARQCFTVAAEENLPAQYHLAHCLAHGIGGEKDLTKAWKLCQDAADQGLQGTEELVAKVLQYRDPSRS